MSDLPSTQRQFSTPMMKQYWAIKQQYPDCLLLFRLGDFYELFLEDARLGAKVLDIVLTRRPRGKDGDIPMAGVPFHTADSYIARLVKAGYKVAICEQVSEPTQKGIVDRAVVRIITPGTILDEKTLLKKEHNYTMCISADDTSLGIAVADLSTGDFQTMEIEHGGQSAHVLTTELARFEPRECIVMAPLKSDDVKTVLQQHAHVHQFEFSEWETWSDNAVSVLHQQFGEHILHQLGITDKQHALRSSAVMLGYLKHTQKGAINHIQTLTLYTPDDHVHLDRATMVNLELFTTIRDRDIHGSLMSVLDRTHTAMGGRLLRAWMRKPLRHKQAIEQRLFAIEQVLHNHAVRRHLEKQLRQLYDLERIVSRLSVGIGNAQDLVNIKTSLTHVLGAETASKLLDVPLLAVDEAVIETITHLIAYIDQHIVDDPPIDTKHGGLLKSGINPTLDALRDQVGGGKNWVAQLEETERKRTGIGSLKVKYNQVFGYYIEISRANAARVPANYIRKQTLVNAERYITPELKDYEHLIMTSEESINRIEYDMFTTVVDHVLKNTSALQTIAHWAAVVDCVVAGAAVAEQYRFTKPQIVEDGTITIRGGRHPVVEHLLVNRQFVPNDVTLNQTDHQLLLITGPNMAGKSVYIRQVALIVLMAHMGMYVPAEEATISLVDRIFVRSGASDVITAGLSTFMVEMVETAHILNHATRHSLIVMDEIGRGTSTYDGISIAWAVAEYLVTHTRRAAKTLFATHYHELQALEQQYPEAIKNYHMVIEEHDGEPVFLHHVMPGGASHSYGVAVARLAGVPPAVTKRALSLLSQFQHDRVTPQAPENLTIRNKQSSP